MDVREEAVQIEVLSDEALKKYYEKREKTLEKEEERLRVEQARAELKQSWDEHMRRTFGV